MEFLSYFWLYNKTKNMENTQETVKTPEQIAMEEQINKEFRELMEEYTK